MREDLKKYQHCKTQLGPALMTLGRVMALTLVACALSLDVNLLVWLLGQVLLGFAVLQWFVLIHDFGHNYFFKAKAANWIWGHVASFFVLLPFTPWKYIHSQHHTWTGWHDLDPTMTASLPQKATPLKRWVARWSWRLSVPVLALTFSFSNFWNLKKLFGLFPRWRDRWQFIFSIAFVLFCLFGVLPFVPGGYRTWALGYYLFLVIGDPLLISQHSHMPQRQSQGDKVRPVPVYEQGVFTRSLIFPAFISKYGLLNFNSHEAHHVYPTIPCYWLQEVHLLNPAGVQIHWWTWLKRAKMLPVDQVLFSNREETGWDI